MGLATWFEDGELNVSWNCLDKHVEAGRGDRVAYHWVGEPADETKDVTYAEMLEEASRLANALRSLGVRKGDRVGIYMGMVPELPIAMLACASAAPHRIVFGGFSSESLAGAHARLGAKFLITQDEGWRKGGKVPLKVNADKRRPTRRRSNGSSSIAAQATTSRGRTVAICGGTSPSRARDVCEPERMGAEDTLLPCTRQERRPSRRACSTRPPATSCTSPSRTSGSSTSTTTRCGGARPTSAGSPATATSCTARSTTARRASSTRRSRLSRLGPPLEIVERYGVNSYYTAPTLIRSFVKVGRLPETARSFVAPPPRHGRRRINPEAWLWYWKVIGGERCPIVDTWWQTENGGILITPLYEVTTLKPGSATVPFPESSRSWTSRATPSPGRGPHRAAAVAGDVPNAVGGRRALRADVLLALRAGTYFTGDGAKQDSDGYFWLMGRIDDVINVAGHRLSTTEIESTLVEHEAVAEAAATGCFDPERGQRIVCFVLLKEDVNPPTNWPRSAAMGGPEDRQDRRPAAVLFDDLPKTRSGKIMRRLLKDIAEGNELGDTTTLRDASVCEDLKRKADAASAERG